MSRLAWCPTTQRAQAIQSLPPPNITFIQNILETCHSRHSFEIEVRVYFDCCFLYPLSLSPKPLFLFPFLSPLSPPPSLSSLNIPAAAPTQPPMSFSFRVAAVSTSARCLAHLPPSPPTHHGTASSPSPPPPLLLLSHSSAGAPQAHASRPNRVARSGV